MVRGVYPLHISFKEHLASTQAHMPWSCLQLTLEGRSCPYSLFGEECEPSHRCSWNCPPESQEREGGTFY